MNLENNIPKSKTPEFKESSNPLTKDAMRALAIVLGVIVVISAAVYAANFGKKKESTIVPTKTVSSLTKEATLSASPSSARKVHKPTGASTPAVEGASN